MRVAKVAKPFRLMFSLLAQSFIYKPFKAGRRKSYPKLENVYPYSSQTPQRLQNAEYRDELSAQARGHRRLVPSTITIRPS